jgi:hypothetical protein
LLLKTEKKVKKYWEDRENPENQQVNQRARPQGRPYGEGDTDHQQ